MTAAVFEAAELTAMRAEAEEAMTDTAAIQRREATGDNRGGRTLGPWETVSGLETVPCRYWQKGSEPREVEGTTRVQVVSLWGFAFPHEVDGETDYIGSTDRIVVGARTFEVVQGGDHTDASELVVTALEVV